MKLITILLLLLSVPAYAATEILAAVAAAGTSSSFIVTNNGKKTIIIAAASGHTAAEYSDVQISNDGGTTFADLYQDGTQVRLHSTNTAVRVEGPGIFRVDKETTSNATSISVSEESSL